MKKTRHQVLTTFCILLFAFCIFCTFGAISASAAEATDIASGDCSAEGSSVQWKYDDTTNTLTIFGKGAMADYSSTSSRPWYDCEDAVTTVVVERGITHIGENSFAYFDSLTTVTVADTVETIGESAFFNCDNLTSVKLPDSVRSIGGSAFSYCDNLTEIKLPMSLKSIYSYTFYSCKSLTSIVIPNSLESIYSDAFGVMSTEPIPFITVHYSGTKAEWNEIYIDSEGNPVIKNGTRHYCTETSWKAASCTTEGQEGGIYCSFCEKYVKEPNTLPINPDNHKSFDIETGLCGCGQQFEARIGDTPYATFADAFAAAKAGDTVVACTGKSGAGMNIPEGVIFDGGEYEFAAYVQNYGEIIGGKYTDYLTNYGKITDGLFESADREASNMGEIAGGVFNIDITFHSGSVTGGTFSGTVTVFGNIDSGHFTESAVINFAADQKGIYHTVINGGTFDCDIKAFGKIVDGIFNGEITNRGEIYGGVFNGEVANGRFGSKGNIYGGSFNAKVTNGINDQGIMIHTGYIYGGSFNAEILNIQSTISNVSDDYTFTLGEGFFVTNNEGQIICEEHFKLSDATCTAQAICRICGSYGEMTNHSWTDATCESPNTCSVCKITEGAPLGHDFADATTDAPKTCKNCGATDGEPLPMPEAPVTPDESVETNWFIRIWNAILDFFRRLFGIEKRK